MRGAKGLLFDANPVERLHIEGSAPDPWSRLRREYTGPRFFFHLLLLVAFLVPYAARVLILSAQSQMYESAERISRHVDHVPDEAAWVELMRQGIERYRETHEQTRAAWVLIGGTKAWYFVGLAVAIILYNALRAYLTSKVSMLRDAEERSKITPSLEEYYGVCHPLAYRHELLGIKKAADQRGEAPRPRDWPGVWWSRVRKLGWRGLSPVPVIGLYRVHVMATWLFCLAVISFMFNAVVWIYSTKVWVPMVQP